MNLPKDNSAVYILVIDDDDDDHYLLKKAIDQVIPEAVVESLYDGTEARKFLEHCTTLPDLVFLDLNMPLLPGLSTLKVIRENKAFSRVPVIMLTTSTHERDRLDALEQGASDFFSKPYQLQVLIDIVEKVKQKWLLHHG